jgi:radical SAM protein with 4Fe4S-binding SPASM domain
MTCHARGAPAVDLARSNEVMEVALRDATILTPSQKENVRAKARDLVERRSVWESVPFRVLFEFNRRCNVQCVHCSIDRRGKGELGVDVLERVLDEIGGGTMELMPLLGGEPTLAPIAQAAPLLRRHGVYLDFITNGVLFDREYFAAIADITARVQFSFHSHRREEFARIMPQADFDVVVRNIRDAVAIAERTGAHVVPCVVPMYDLLPELDDYVAFVADLGVRRLIVQNLYPHTPALRRLDPAAGRDPAFVDECYERAFEAAARRGVFLETNVAQLFGREANRAPPPSRFDILQENAHVVELFQPGFCISTANQAVIEWDGTVLPCIRDRIVLGNVLEGSFRDAWNGPAMQELRDRHFGRLPPRSNCELCRGFYMGHP